MRERTTLAVIAAAGLILRARGLFTEFWLDEIWSLHIAQEARSPLDIFTRLTHDNNHPLNTLYLYALGLQPTWIPYRLLALVSGIATVVILVRCADGARERIAVALLGALSLPMVVYGTEARGYAPAAMFALAAYAWRRRPWFSAIASALAVLAHLTAVYVWVALLVRDLVRRDRPLLPHLLPLATSAWLYAVFVRHLTVGGGTPSSRVGAALAAAAMAAGGTGIVASLAGLGAIILALRKSDDVVFFAVAIFVAPAAAMLWHRGEYVNARYFFVLLPFVLLLFARLAARMPAPLSTALLAVWTLATASQLVPFLRHGRGSYREALAFIGSGDVSGDNDFRNATLIDFYAPRRIRYHSQDDPAYGRTPWFLIESFDRVPHAFASVRTAGGSYALAGVFRYGGVSGWNWLVYRRTGGSGSSSPAPPGPNPASIQR